MALDRAEAIVDVSPIAFVSMDEDGRIRDWSVGAEEVFGLERADVVGTMLADTIIPPRYREAHREGLERFLQSGAGQILDRRVELSAIRADGSEFPVEMTVSASAVADGWSFRGFIADTSARREADRARQRSLEELQRALRGSEQRLSVIMDALAEAVTIRGPDNHLIYANRAALDRLGLGSVEELRDADPRALMGPYETTGERGQPIEMDDLPSVRLLRGEQPEPLLLKFVNRDSGEEQWALLKATAVRNASGAVEAAVTIIEDATASKRSSLRAEFLARASQVLASSLDYQETLRNVARLAVPQIADWCAVDLFDDDGGRESVAVAHADPTKLQMAERLREFEPEELDPRQGLGRVKRTGEALLFTDIPDRLLAAAALDAEHLRLLRAVGMRSALLVPMTVQNRTIGALTLVSAESGRRFDQGDLEFAGQVAARASLAVENARLYTERSEVARTLQRSLLPESLPEIPGWEIVTLYQPAEHGSEVGGDFYDFWELDGDWLMVIGDVAGKGAGAAAVTSLVRHTARTASEFDPRPAQILARADAALKRSPSVAICTALCIRFAEGQGTIAVGGHPLALRLSPDGVHEVGQPGTLLGAFDEVRWPETRFALEPGETLVAITDGVTDAVGPEGERFGLRRLHELLAAARDETPAAIRRRLVTSLEKFQVGAQADDTAVVLMRFTGVRERGPRPSIPGGVVSAQPGNRLA